MPPLELELVGMQGEQAELLGRALAVLTRQAGGTLRLSAADLAAALKGELVCAFKNDGSIVFGFIEGGNQ